MQSMKFGRGRLNGGPYGFSALVGTALVTVLTVSVGVAGVAQAEDLDDQNSALKKKIENVQESLEFLDTDIAETVAMLETYQGQLPAAQQELADAQGRVVEATNEVNGLSQRVDLAQQTKDKISQQIDQDKAEMTETKKVIGQIATQAYKNGGVPSSISLILGADGADNLTSSINLADQAMRSQGAAMDRLAQQNATNANSEARLVSVETEIRDLKAQAEEALAREQGARDDAASQKEHVDKLIADTSSLSAKLEAQRPVVQKKLEQTRAAQEAIQEQIAERQRKLLEEARRQAEEQRRQAAAAEAAAEKAAAAAAAAEKARQEQIERDRREAAKNNRPAPPPPPPVKPAPAPAPAPAPVAPGSPSAFGLKYPVNAPISSGFGWRPTPSGTIDFGGIGGYLHSGIDFAPPCGTPVYAPASGEVWYADQGGGQMVGTGNRIVINHGIVRGNVLATNFYHLQSMSVYSGQRVSAGQLIGRVGNTGNSSGCHLHFETMLNGELVNPMGLM